MKEIMAAMALGQEGGEIAGKVADGVDKGVKIYDDHIDRVKIRKQAERTANLEYVEKEIMIIDEAVAKAPNFIHNLVDAGSEIMRGVRIAGNDLQKIKEELHLNNHGSKVKMGLYSQCKIEEFADMACIVDADNGMYILLTPNFVSKCRYIKKKFRPIKMKNYYYYDIIFTDGNRSYIRVSQKYREYLEKYLMIEK